MLTRKEKDSSLKNDIAESYLCSILNKRVGGIDDYQEENTPLPDKRLKESIDAGAQWLEKQFFRYTVRSPEYFTFTCSDGEIGSIRTFFGGDNNFDLLFAYNDTFHDYMDAELLIFIISTICDINEKDEYTPSEIIKLLADTIVKDVRVGMSLLEQLHGYDFCIIGFKDERMQLRMFNIYETIVFKLNNPSFNPFKIKEVSDTSLVISYDEDFEITVNAEVGALSNTGVFLEFGLMSLKPVMQF